MNGAATAEGARAWRSVWPWTLAYAALTLSFVPLWPDFETARRGLGNLFGALALLLLFCTPGAARLPWRMLWPWLALVGVHLLSCAFASNPGDGLARTAWLASLGAMAALAARHSDVTTQFAAMAIVGAGVAGFGLAQSLGLPWPLGYSDPHDPVSTLGNRNVAAEVTATAVVAAAILLLRARRATGAALAVSLGVAYLWVNHSRSGLLATTLTVAPLILAPWRPHPLRRRALLFALVASGLLLGQLVRAQLQRPPAAASPGATSTDTEPRDSSPGATIEVRFEIWNAGLHMLADAPLGIGAAQFKGMYPRYRTQREIELSTNGREFAAAPLTAHNDPLEVAIETGVLGLLLYLVFWWEVLRSRRHVGVVVMAPVAAFLILGLVRSPLGNAPAAAFAFACVGAVCRERLVKGGAVSWQRRLLGGALATPILVLGGRECAGQCAAAPHLREERRLPGERATLLQAHALDRAVAFCPWDIQLLAMRSSLRLVLAKTSRDPAAAARALVAPGNDLDRLLRYTPFETGTLLRAAAAFQMAQDPAATMRLLSSILSIDPPNPEARLFLATERAQQGDASGAIAALYGQGAPHARLRAGLARHFRDLAHVAANAAAQALAHEADFVAAVDALQAQQPAAEEIKRFVAGATRDDLRPLVLLALGSLRAGDRATAETAGDRAPADARLDDVHARFLADLLPDLRALPAWRPRLSVRS